MPDEECVEYECNLCENDIPCKCSGVFEEPPGGCLIKGKAEWTEVQE